jgi:hypothetical protein
MKDMLQYITMFDCKCLGATDAETKRYVRPGQASKGRQYVCIDCKESVTFRCGKIKRPHFAHKPGSNCSYYNHCNESQIHKEAKLALKQYLEDGNVLDVFCRCTFCHEASSAEIKLDINTETVVCEYVAEDNCRYDVCIVDQSNNVRCVLEVKHTHATSSYRPEPWYELNASEILLSLNSGIEYRLYCERERECSKCDIDRTISRDPLFGLIRYRNGSKCLMCKTRPFDPYKTRCLERISICQSCMVDTPKSSIFERLKEIEDEMYRQKQLELLEFKLNLDKEMEKHNQCSYRYR